MLPESPSLSRIVSMEEEHPEQRKQRQIIRPEDDRAAEKTRHDSQQKQAMDWGQEERMERLEGQQREQQQSERAAMQLLAPESVPLEGREEAT